MRKYAAALVCLVVGCAAGSALPTITAQSFGPNPSATRWDQYCEEMHLDRYSNNSDITRLASALVQRRGREGWEATFIVAGGICFKRPAAQ